MTTASGNEFAFTPGSDPADEPVFVKGGTRLTVTGTARRQSPTGTGEGHPEMPTTVILWRIASPDGGTEGTTCWPSPG